MIVALSILRPTRSVDNIGQLARLGVKQAVTCTLVLASFRRLLRQEGPPAPEMLDPKMCSGGSLLSVKWFRSLLAQASLAQGCLGSSPHRQVGLGFQSPRFSGSLVFSLPPRLSGSLRLTAPGCTLILRNPLAQGSGSGTPRKVVSTRKASGQKRV